MTEQPWESWWYGGDYYDRQANRRIADVEAAQSAARNRLATQMAKQQGNLQGQIDRLTEAFVAMVEYEDIRGELNEHAAAAATRKYAREVVPNLVVTGGTGLDAIPMPPGVYNYWLSWAVRGLVATATGGDGSEQLARAHQLDQQRTSLLVVLIDAIRRELRFSADHLAATLPTTSQITLAQRGLWTAITAGSLGEPAHALLEQRLRDALGTPDPVRIEEWVRGLVLGQRDVPQQIRAAQTIRALAEKLQPSLHAYTPDGAAQEGARTGETGRGETEGRSEDPLAELVRTLVDEGAPGEDEVLDRMAEVRNRMGFVQKRDTQGRWSAPAGDVYDLLLGDLEDADAPAGLRELAIRLLGPSYPAVVESLMGEAAVVPPEAEVRTSGARVVVGAVGVQDGTWRDEFQRKVAEETAVSTAFKPLAYAAFAVGVVGLVLLVLSPAWLVLALVGFGAGAGLLLQERSLQRDGAAERQRRLQRADDDIEHATLDHAALLELHRTELAAATEAAGRIERVLPHGATGAHAGVEALGVAD